MPKIFLDKIRKNLMTLICQADIAELTGDLNAFGGEKDVASNISKAVFGLFCLGSVFGVSVSEAIERYVADVTMSPWNFCNKLLQLFQITSE
jgi:hypothetical protein